jgi:hypothetical protein
MLQHQCTDEQISMPINFQKLQANGHQPGSSKVELLPTWVTSLSVTGGYCHLH